MPNLGEFGLLIQLVFQLVDFMVKATTHYILNGGELAAAEWAQVEELAEQILGKDLNASGAVGDNPYSGDGGVPSNFATTPQDVSGGVGQEVTRQPRVHRPQNRG